jgi:hypothetical protein
MKGALFALLLGAGLVTGPAAAGSWPAAEIFLAAQSDRGRSAAGSDQAERGERAREPRQDRPVDRRDRMTDDERRSLHRDLDKANRELYGRRPQR